MSAEGFIISNPQNNNRDVAVTFVGRDGKRKKYKTLRPGEACSCDKKQVQVEEVERPPRLVFADGQWLPDKSMSHKNARRV